MEHKTISDFGYHSNHSGTSINDSKPTEEDTRSECDVDLFFCGRMVSDLITKGLTKKTLADHMKTNVKSLIEQTSITI